MKRKVKSYLAFTPRFFHVLTFLAAPALIVAEVILFNPADVFMAGVLITVSLFSAELYLDFFVFGGILAKGGGNLEYFRSSPRGVEVIGAVLSVNMARQVIQGAALVGLGSVIPGLRHGFVPLDGELLISCAGMILVEYICLETLITVTRFFESILINMLFACVGAFLILGGLYLTMKNIYIALPILAVLAVAGGSFGMRLTTRRIKEGYYDKAD